MSVPEYVYALHDFYPEHEDEIAFYAGQPIEIIERDDQYSDGWWQGRNIAGKIGLFPKSYTNPSPPTPLDPISPSESIADPSLNTPPDTLQPLNEDSDPSFSLNDSEFKIGIALGEPLSPHHEVMKATMTDVQKAIEQLGQNDRDDAARSFSFTSTGYDDTDRETDTETDGDGDASLHDFEQAEEQWHRTARDKLAEQSRKVVEEKAATDAEIIPQRSLAPPIEIEMSDESEVEEEDDSFNHLQSMRHFSRDHPHIPEEDEGEGDNNPAEIRRHHGRNDSSATAILPSEFSLSRTSGDGEQAARVHKATSSITSTSPLVSAAHIVHRRGTSKSWSPPVSPIVNVFAPIPVVPVEPSFIRLPIRTVSPEPTTQTTPTPEIREIHEVSNAISSILPAVSPPPLCNHNSVASTGQDSTTSMLQSSWEPMRVSSPLAKSVPASDWSVEEVTEWLKSKGFAQDVCDKFTEQEITGDVMLELDINLLKTEIGIVAFGKRMRIANAISELRRPPSIIFPDGQSPQHLPSSSHSRSQSYSYSRSHSSSTHQSLNSPMFATTISSAITAPNSSTLGSMFSLESPPADISRTKRVSSLSSTGPSVNGGLENNVLTGATSMVGLGLRAFVNSKGKEHIRTESALAPSPSDGALHKRFHSQTIEPAEVQDDDRGALSEGESAPSTGKQRRRLFGRSSESSSTTKEKGYADFNNNSTTALSTSSALIIPSPTRSLRVREPMDDTSIVSRHSSKHSWNKRGTDGATKAGGERHSMFGSSFTTSLGKTRKPPPKITPSLMDNEGLIEKSSSLNLSRIYGGRKASGRPNTSELSISSTFRNSFRGDILDEKKKSKEKTSEKPKEKNVDKDKESSLELKKLTDVGPESQSRGPSGFKPGQSIIEQIGTPDHEGWMRKKGDHYNAWKVRYFVIKGPHLYILRSDTKTETKIKGYVNIVGYKVIADENIDPGRYGFRIVHDTDKTHFFSSDEQVVVREWMKAIMKATIGRDYSKPVVSSVNIPTIPLTVAQAMNPAPRPPSPTARDATQKALRRENPSQLSTRDARVLMGLPSPDASDPRDGERMRLDSFFSHQPVSGQAEDETTTGFVTNKAPPRPTRRMSASVASLLKSPDAGLIEWANSHLPTVLQNQEPTEQLYGGLALLRLAESIVGKSISPPLSESAFPSGPNDDNLDGLFRLFDFLLANDVKMGSVSINDIRQGKRDKIVQLLNALKAWEDRRKDILRSIGLGAVQTGALVAPSLKSWKM